jgi:hypothetical protein
MTTRFTYEVSNVARFATEGPRSYSTSAILNAAPLSFPAEDSLSDPISGFRIDSDPSGATTSAPFGISEKRLELRTIAA